MFTAPIFIYAEQLSRLHSSNGKLESDEKSDSTDLICEGPIEGLVDRNGNLLKYVTDTDGSQIDNIILGKGIYYNEVPLIDSKLNKLNFVTAGFDIFYGDEINNLKNEFPSTVFRYNQKMYLNEYDYTSSFPIGLNGVFAFAVNHTNSSKEYVPISTFGVDSFASALSVRNLSDLERIFNNSLQTVQEFSHKIRNKYCDTLSIQIKIDQLFKTDKDGTVLGGDLFFAIEMVQDNSSDRILAIASVSGISKAGYTTEIVLPNLSLDTQNQNSYYVKVYALSRRLAVSEARSFKDFTVSAIIEKILNRGSFSYPFSAIVKSSVSARNFNGDPARSFDLKLLKIKVPSNYDPEVHEYSGNWNGNFDAFLRWTDNPAWIFYDICTNTRYGVGNGKILEKDLNKWELYKIAKYCDELIKTNQPLKYNPINFWIDANYPNCVLVNKQNYSLEEFKEIYPPVNDNPNYASKNGGFANSIIYLYDLKDDNLEDITKCLKKIIWSVEELDGCFKIQLINDFGPRRAFEKESSGNLFADFKRTNVLTFSDSADNGGPALGISSRIAAASKNTEDGAKSFILDWYVKNLNSVYVNQILNEEVFQEDYLEANLNIGFCSPKTLNFKDAVEPRFTCNILIDNETDCLKLLNDIASVFRGITYYKNNLICSTIDVNKKVSYLFNNSNVKNGEFNYSTASLEGSYTVAKVMYKDKFENFNDQVEIVEDTQMIKQYGIITKEILGFGITSKNQARRIGEWMLMTNRFENQTVAFSTDIQGLIIKPGDVIQIQDQFKNDTSLQGRVTSTNYANKFITIDRKISLNLTGAVIKFIYDSLHTTVDDLSKKQTVTLQDINNLDSNNVISLKIARIENNTNRIYFDETYNFADFYKILQTSPFIIEDPNVNNSENLYKIVTISEADNNEYSIFAIKHDPNKYDFLDNNKFEDANANPVNNTIALTNYENLTEINFGDRTFWNINQYTLGQIQNLSIDHYFNEQRSSLIYSGGQDYSVLFIDFIALFKYVNDQADTSDYFLKIKNVLLEGGGVLCKLTLKNQTIKFSIPYSSSSNKSVFLGKYFEKTSISSGVLVPASINAVSGIRLYLYNKDSQIIEV